MKTIREQIITLKTRSDYEWYKELAFKDRYGKKLDVIALDELINKAIQSAEIIHKHLIDRFGVLKPVDYVRKLEIIINYSHQVGDRMYIALYDHIEREIDLNLSAVDMIKSQIISKDCEDLINKEKIIDVAFMHEVYHNLEMTLPNIYTYEKIIDYKFVGLFKMKKRSLLASEIGAIHFSKLANELNYSPKLYEKILTTNERK